MNTENHQPLEATVRSTITLRCLIALMMSMLITLTAQAEDTSAQSENLVPAVVFTGDATVDLFNNLVPVKDAQVGMAYIDPDADFSVFKQVMILEPFVAFRSNWQRSQNRGSRRNRVSIRDMERIKSNTADLFKDVFIEQLQAAGGFEIVSMVMSELMPR